MRQIKNCVINGCQKKHEAKGYCQHHYDVVYRKESRKLYRKKYAELNKEKRREKRHQYYLKNKQKEVSRTLEWKKQNKERWALTQKRRFASQRSHTPAWANIEKINEIYAYCPKDMQVDHYYPINGEYVSGLHIETNLQYLPRHLNGNKSNKTPGIDWPTTNYQLESEVK